jgi:hypothetical protein
MILLTYIGFLGATRKVSHKNFVGFEEFSLCFAHKKSENFGKNHLSLPISKRIQALFTTPPQCYAVFYALQSDMHPINRKNLQAKLLHKQRFEVFSVVRKIIDVWIHPMAQGMA